MQFLRELRRENEEIRSILGCIETALDQIADEAFSLDFGELAEAMYFMTQFRDIVHHNKEALLLRQLARRRRDLRETVRTMNHSHGVLKADGVAFLELLEDAAEETIVSREEMLARGRRYVESQRSHLQALEEHVLPEAEASLDKEDWRTIRRRLGRGHDGDIEQVTWEQFEALYRNLTGDATASMPSRKPGSRIH